MQKRIKAIDTGKTVRMQSPTYQNPHSLAATKSADGRKRQGTSKQTNGVGLGTVQSRTPTSTPSPHLSPIIINKRSASATYSADDAQNRQRNPTQNKENSLLQTIAGRKQRINR